MFLADDEAAVVRLAKRVEDAREDGGYLFPPATIELDRLPYAMPVVEFDWLPCRVLAKTELEDELELEAPLTGADRDPLDARIELNGGDATYDLDVAAAFGMEAEVDVLLLPALPYF